MLGNSVDSKLTIPDCDYCHGPIDEIHQSPEKPWGLHLRQKFVNYKQNSPACRECRNHHKPMAYLGQGKDMKACNMESFADEIDLQVKDGQDMMRCSANMFLIGWTSCGQSTKIPAAEIVDDVVGRFS